MIYVKIAVFSALYVAALTLIISVARANGVWQERMRHSRARKRAVEEMGEVPTDDWPGFLLALDKLAPPVDETFWSVVRSKDWPEDKDEKRKERMAKLMKDSERDAPIRAVVEGDIPEDGNGER